MSDLGNKKIMAKNIQALMKSHGVTRKKLADDLDVSYTTLSDWVNGNSYPRIDKIEMMANYFHVSKADLVEQNKKPSTLSVDEAINSLNSYQGKPVSDDQKAIIKDLIKGYLDRSNKNE